MRTISKKSRTNIRERLGNFYLIRCFLMAAALSAAPGSVEAAPNLEETGSWLVRTLLDLGKHNEMGAGTYGEVIAADWTECNLIITTSVEMEALDSITITKADIPMRYFKELVLKKFGGDTREYTMFTYNQNNSIRWLQSNEVFVDERSDVDYAFIPVRDSGRDVKDRLEAGLQHFAKLAGENETCRKAEPF